MIQQLLQSYWPEWNGDMVNGPTGWNNTTLLFITRIGVRSCAFTIRIVTRQGSNSSLRSWTCCSGHPLAFRFQRLFHQRLAIRWFGFRTEVIVTLAYSPTLKERDRKKRAFKRRIPSGKNGELVCALAACPIGMEPVYPPYYELLQSYPSCSRTFIQDFCKQPPVEFQEQGNALQILHEAYTEISGRLESLKNLPQQLVHGDLNFSNLLVDSEQSGKVIALLDFEFCTKDVRAMEPAVVISGFLGMAEEKDAIRQFCEGFASRVRLTEEEIAAIPVLLRLRLVDVFLHF